MKNTPLISSGIVFVFVFVVLSLLAGCNTSETVKYEHRPSESFYNSMSFEMPGLEGFKDDGVLFVVSLKQASFEEYWAWLGLYAKEAPDVPVYVLRANFLGDGWEENYQVDSEVLFSGKVTDSGLVTEGVLLHKISGELLKRFERESEITLEVVYLMEGEEKAMSFLLERRVERQTVFST